MNLTEKAKEVRSKLNLALIGFCIIANFSIAETRNPVDFVITGTPVQLSVPAGSSGEASLLLDTKDTRYSIGLPFFRLGSRIIFSNLNIHSSCFEPPRQPIQATAGVTFAQAAYAIMDHGRVIVYQSEDVTNICVIDIRDGNQPRGGSADRVMRDSTRYR